MVNWEVYYWFKGDSCYSSLCESSVWVYVIIIVMWRCEFMVVKFFNVLEGVRRLDYYMKYFDSYELSRVYV